MEKVLNQEEIDAMVRAARSGGGSELPRRNREVAPWDVRQAGQIGREQLQAITLLHEGFARNLTHALGAYLRIVFAAALVSAEHLTYGEFLQRIPETTYLASCRLDPVGVSAALQLDLTVLSPSSTCCSAAKARASAATREITDIEEQILDTVARIICRELGVAWQALALEVGFEERLETGAAGRLMAPAEKILSLSFEVTMPEVRGGLNLAVPAVVSNALLRKIAAEWSHRRLQGASDSRQRIMRRLLECPFLVELAAEDLPVAVRALAGLGPGQQLRLARSAAEPASLAIAGCAMFHALPARCGAARAARVLERASIPDWAQDSRESAK